MEEKALLDFERLLREIPALAPHQVHAVLSVCRGVEKLPQDAVRWVCDAAMLTRESDAARELLKDLFELVDHKLQKENSCKLKRDALMKLVRTLVFHHRNGYRFACEGNLAQFLGAIDEPSALDYYDKSIVGVVFDKLGAADRYMEVWEETPLQG